jgi:hypothetical protein
LATGVRPLPESTRTFPPSRSKATPVGYQPVGMKPRKRLSPERVTSTTATVLLSAFATSSVWPSGESASAFGVEPGGARGESATAIFSAATRVATSTTQTAFVLAHATKRRRPSFENCIAFGCSPTRISSIGASVLGCSTAIFAPPQTET